MSNISISQIYTELEKMTPAERVHLLATTNPLKEMARKKREETWQKIRAYIDERISEYAKEYKEEWKENYVEALRNDKISSMICQTDDFDKLIDNYFELSI